jgi:hypothetical protein
LRVRTIFIFKKLFKKEKNLKRKKNRWKTKKIILDNFIKAKAQTKINKINLKSSLLELQRKWEETK